MEKGQKLQRAHTMARAFPPLYSHKLSQKIVTGIAGGGGGGLAHIESASGVI